MQQISKYFEEVSDCYYINRQGKVYNTTTNKQIKTTNNCYALSLKAGNTKKYSLKKLYKACFGEVYCINNIKSLEGEEWKVIPHTNEEYLCSNLGRVISLKGYEATLMIPTISDKGYKRLQITVEGKRKEFLLHTIVAKLFLFYNPQEDTMIKTEVHHINQDKTDNRADNLCYMRADKHRKLHDKLRKEQRECQKNGD